MWTDLYTDLAATSAAVIEGPQRNDRRPQARGFVRAFGFDLVLNARWSAIFWRARRFDVIGLEAAGAMSSHPGRPQVGAVSTGPPQPAQKAASGAM